MGLEGSKPLQEFIKRQKNSEVTELSEISIAIIHILICTPIFSYAIIFFPLDVVVHVTLEYLLKKNANCVFTYGRWLYTVWPHEMHIEMVQ